MLRCKFKFQQVTKLDNARVVQLSASNEKDGDNEDWSKYTPCGDLTITVTNESAFEQIDQMNPGDHYYLDIKQVSVDA